jgi:hypothetical protein
VPRLFARSMNWMLFASTVTPGARSMATCPGGTGGSSGGVVGIAASTTCTSPAVTGCFRFSPSLRAGVGAGWVGSAVSGSVYEE